MPRKKQTFQTVNGPVTVNVPINSELEGGLRILIDHSDIKQKWFDVPYGPHPDEVMDIYLPNEGEGPFPVIVMVHGGGWSDGDKNYWEVYRLDLRWRQSGTGWPRNIRILPRFRTSKRQFVL